MDSLCPTPSFIIHPMKRSIIERDLAKEWEKVAGFGEASLMRDVHGRFAIWDGTEEERRRMLAWAERHMTDEDGKPPRWI
ncbi:MAG: hypothetical protein JWR26_3238 [Pedosphaera sp.]|nr:hypothetical protein [Pedosphaera sp.]